jgi:hypothetical protein
MGVGFAAGSGLGHEAARANRKNGSEMGRLGGLEWGLTSTRLVCHELRALKGRKRLKSVRNPSNEGLAINRR